MKNNKIIYYVLIPSIVFILVFSFGKEYYRKEKLKRTKKAFAVMVEFSTGTVRHSMRGTFQYKINNNTYKFIQSEDFSMLTIGDTVEIEYSIEDNSVARVINKHYMDKYKWNVIE